MVARPAHSRRESHRRLTVAGGGLTLLLGLGAAAIILAEPPPTSPHPTHPGSISTQAAPAASLLSLCHAFTNVDGNTVDWARGVEACTRALAADPISVDAHRLKRQAEKELAQKAIYDRAHRLFDLGEVEAAMQEYLGIESDSSFYRLARSEFRSAAPAALKNAGDLCVFESRGDLWEKAWPDCKRMMDLGAYLGLEGSLQTRGYQRAFAEAQRHAHGRAPWSARRDYQRFLEDPAGVDDGRQRLLAAIRQRYTDSELADAVARYASDPALGVQAIQRYLGKGGHDEAQARELYRHMVAASGSHQVGYERLLSLDLKGAVAPFHAQLESDAKVMPQGFESDLTRQTRRDISDRFAKRGQELFEEGRFAESFDACQAGADFQLGNPAVLQCFSDLEVKAAGWAGQGCSGASRAARVTRTDSPSHQKAEHTLVGESC